MLAAGLAAVLSPFATTLLSGRTGLWGVPAPDAVVAGDADVYDSAWHFWWIRRATTLGLDPRVCGLVGTGAPRPLSSHNIGWPSAMIFGGLAGMDPVEGLDAAVVFGTVLTYLAAAGFARSWGLGPGAAAIAAAAVAWSPARTAHLIQHYQVASLGWLAASLWLQRIHLTRGGALPLVLSAAAGAAAAMESPYHALMLIVSSPLCAIASGGRPAARAVSVLPAVVSAAAGWLFYESFPGPLETGTEAWEAVYWSGEPLSLAMPGPFGTAGVLTGLAARMWWMPNLFEGVVTPGLVMAGLAAASFAGGRHRALVVAAALLLLLAMGPELKILGRPTGIPLPAALLRALPPLGGARSMARFAMPAALLLSVPAAAALSRIPRPAGAVIALLMAAEILPPSVPVLPATVPAFYRTVPDGATVLEIPADPMARRYCFFMTVDGAARPVFWSPRHVYRTEERLAPFMSGASTAPGPAEAEGAGVDYLVYNRWLFTGEERDRLDSLYSGIFPSAGGEDSVLVWHR